MKFLRLLSNSLIAGYVFSLLLAVLFIDLNINLAFRIDTLLKLSLLLMSIYGLAAALLCLGISYIYRFISGKRSPVGFFSASFQTLGISILTLLFLIVFRENYTYFLSFFVPRVQFILRAQMMALFVLAIAGIVFHHRYHHRRPQRIFLVSFFILAGAVLAFVLGERMSYPAPSKAFRLGTLQVKNTGRKVSVLCLEGLNPELVISLAAEHKVPNFSWMMEQGSWGRLEGFTPSEAYVLSHTFATGKFPGKHRLISAETYHLPWLSEELEVVPRFILFKQLRRIGVLKVMSRKAPLSAADIWKICDEAGTAVVNLNRPTAVSSTPINPKTDKRFAAFYKDFQNEASSTFNQVKEAFARDAEAEDEAFQAKSAAPPRLFSLTLGGLSTAEAYFYKYSFPEAFGDIRPDDIQKYGMVIEKYYQFYDQIIGKLLASLKEDELCIVYAPFSMEPLPFWKRIVEWILGNAAVSSSHEQAPPGMALFYGKGIVRGKNLDPLRIVDLAPTILYYLGLPVGKDMDGVVRGSLFERDFTEENPVLTISSYEETRIERAK